MMDDFIAALRMNVEYWDKQNDRSTKEKLEGLTFSILCILDGVSGSYDGDIDDIRKLSCDTMLHDNFYEKETP